MQIIIKHSSINFSTEIFINEKNLDLNKDLIFIRGRKLQEWINPNSDWKGVFSELVELIKTNFLEIEFHGNYFDYCYLECANKVYDENTELGLQESTVLTVSLSLFYVKAFRLV